ncbi:MAG TPA: caspase family protein [Acidimicrobiales bacterium]|nr:caspase family protein [Acidimicrobiales bacterium]
MVGALVLVAGLAFNQARVEPRTSSTAASTEAAPDLPPVPTTDFDNLVERLRTDEPAAPVEVAAAPAEAPAPPPPGPPPGQPVEAVIAPPAAEFTEPPVTAPPPRELGPSLAGVTPSSGTWAVVIGVNNYPGTAYDLQSAVNDANDMVQTLDRFGIGAGNRLVLRDGEATASAIRRSVEWMRAHAGPDATAVFFYAGHVRKMGGSTEAVVGADGGVVTDAELARLWDGVQARKSWLVMASCYGAGFTEMLKPGRGVLTAAAPADGLAYENLNFVRSYLGEYLVRRSMLATGTSSVERAFSSAQSLLSKDFPHRPIVQIDQWPGDLDIRPPGAPAPAPLPGPAPAPQPATTLPPSPPTTKPADGCATLTLGLIRCGTP